MQTEIKIHRTLKHLHVVRFERFFEDTLNAYIILELCNNNSMSEMMKRRKKLTEPESRYYLSQLVNALQYLHLNLVIHRDLKLGNLFLDADMRVKVGDFGLATRLTTADEKRRTICGTPNYIAPEILEGKEGHSFEVDIWSAGVILFTLLIGKPPFEAKDVKSTYKRILANQYAFPDHTVVSEHAKSLIRHMLQPRPERRPSLDYILDHSFFTSSSAILPSSLPESALREAPTSFTSSVKDNGLLSKQSVKVNDENDPSAINRININHDIARSNGKVLSGMENVKVSNNKIASSEGVEKRNITRSSSATTVFGDIPSGSNVNTDDNGRTAPLFSAASKSLPSKQNANDKGYSQKFEVYCDLKTNQGSSQVPLKKEVAEKPKMHAKDPAQFKPPLRSTIPERRSSPRDMGVESHHAEKGLLKHSTRSSAFNPDVLDVIQNDLEGVQLVDDSVPMSIGAPAQPLKEAWAIDNSAPMSIDSKKQTYEASTRTPYKNDDIQPALDSDAMQLCTPPDNICKEKAMGTLETMHEMLSNTCGGFEDAMIARVAKISSSESLRKQLDMESLIAKVWVVRYVDYTSKYGLGFLLNTGSAGVYFNDSTKIVLSPSGNVFQYIERKRKDSSSSSEHVVQTHMMENYPIELQKKVTLLRHFRDYLVDQQKTSGVNYSDLGDGQGMPMVMQAGAITGASAAVKFGVSSATYDDGMETTSVECEMPFLKKWVRTRHAILFRLSNRTVQVVFFDRSEVLLSSEARIVTYVNKQGLRSEHSLEEVLQTGRTDIAKRLKYTKDIMYRLINIQAK